jgi:hypothetical protein
MRVSLVSALQLVNQLPDLSILVLKSGISFPTSDAFLRILWTPFLARHRLTSCHNYENVRDGDKSHIGMRVARKETVIILGVPPER